MQLGSTKAKNTHKFYIKRTQMNAAENRGLTESTNVKFCAHTG